MTAETRAQRQQHPLELYEAWVAIANEFDTLRSRYVGEGFVPASVEPNELEVRRNLNELNAVQNSLLETWREASKAHDAFHRDFPHGR